MISDREYDELALEYAQLIVEQPEEAAFLATMPWVLAPPVRSLDPLLTALRFEAPRLTELPLLPIFSLICTLRETAPSLIHELILSLRCQSYVRWELILVEDASVRRDHISVARQWAALDPRIRLLELDRRHGPAAAKEAALAEASGEFTAFIEDSALLHPSALGVVARHFNATPDVNLVFSNEARIDGDTRAIAAFLRKPEFDLFTVLRQNYIGNLAFFRRELLDVVRGSGTVFRVEHDGVEDHDLMIRAGLTGLVRSSGIPLFLYYSRLSPGDADADVEAARYAGEKTIALIENLMPEIHPGARWVVIPPSPARGGFHPAIRLQSLPQQSRPSLLVMIPFKDHADLTVSCLESLERQAHTLSLRVVLIDNQSRNPETPRILNDWLQPPRRNRYEIVEHDGPFNYARIHNKIVERFRDDADLLLFLNNDVELISADCLQAMAMQLLADASCGFVGIRLMYPGDEDVQHGGVKIWADHIHVGGLHWLDHARTRSEYVADERIALGVTFACAMTRTATFRRLGGFEEILFPNGYGDVDLCSRAIEAGLKNYYLGTLAGRHHESRTRTSSIEDLEFVAVHERHGAALLRWRLRDLSCTVIPPPIPVPVGPSEERSEPAPPPPPLRYRIADAVNSTLKTTLGPAHRVVRSGIVRSWRLVRRVRTAADRMTFEGRDPRGSRWGFHHRVLSIPRRRPASGHLHVARDPEEAVR